MANRTARLRRETDAHLKEQTYREALQRSKRSIRMQRSARRLQRDVERQHPDVSNTGEQPVWRLLLRRKSVQHAFGTNSGFFLTVAHCLETGTLWRDLAAWRAPRSRNPLRIFESLTRHVFVRYALPPVLYQALVEAVAVENNPQHPVIPWFFLVARGENLSKAEGLPFEFTKKAAHFLAEAPAGMPVIQAMRWAQVRAWGGNAAVTRSLAGALPQPNTGFESEWSAVIRFMVRHQDDPALPAVQRVVDFVRYQRVKKKALTVGNLHEEIDPLYPAFDIRQATPQSLAQRIETWERHVQAMEKALQTKPFPRLGLGDYYEIDTRYGPVEIRRLKNIAELVTEGTLMHHCVGTYDDWCHKGWGSIWSITANAGNRRLATLELNSDKRIEQVQGKANSQPAVEVVEAVKKWAKMAGVNAY